MRLLECTDYDNFVFTKDFIGDDIIPPYAILSHTWKDAEEVTFDELRNGTGKGKNGYDKLRFCGQQAKRDNLRYFWVDTCCINKSDHVELQDAINSMFRWYRNAAQCYVYLSDVSTAKRKASDGFSEFTWEPAFRASRWFTRGWTLQELLAPRSVKFYSVEGILLGDKGILERQVSETAGIAALALQGTPLSEFGVEERLSWMDRRQTTRKEDKAYSLLGLFGIYMSLIYGEGEENAFRRLRRKIGQQSAAIRIGREDQECIRDLRITDPRDDKKRIEETKGGLLDGSYRWVLENSDFQQWRDDQQRRLLWIKGDPGKGKTMLLCGIAKELEKLVAKPDLLSYFFCQATDPRINNATAVLRGLVYMLVDQQPLLISHIRKKYDYAGKGLFEDANAWVALVEVFINILKDLSTNNTYLVVDALDECVSDLPKLLDFIAQTSSILLRVKWVVSSRNLPSIKEHLKKAGHKIRLSLELNAKSVSTAVQFFIQHKVSYLSQQKNYDGKTHAAVLHHLSANANGTFLWVALACQGLEKIPRWKALEKLRDFPAGLDSLYERMMLQIKNSDDVDLCKQILASLIIAYRPLRVQELTSLVERLDSRANDIDSLQEIVGLCGSFLTIRDGTIYFVHQSAKDFLLKESFQDIFASGKEDAHYIAFSRSLDVISSTLRRDMYGLGALGCSRDEAAMPAQDPLATARYSCVYWVDHLYESTISKSTRCNKDMRDGGAVYRFLQTRYLYWLEALSLCKSMSAGVASMAKLEALLQGRTDATTLMTLVHDARRFIMYHKQGIESAPLQAYGSALLFSPTESLIKKLFQHEKPKHIKVRPGMRDGWRSCLQTLEGHSNWVSSVAFSLDSTRLASASGDKTVKVWDAGSGACLQTLEGHSGWVSSVAFSHDSKRLASASGDKTVKVWDAGSGACLQTLEGHSGWVSSVAFSHDSTRLASASDDKTVKIWDAGSGACLQTLEGYSDAVWSVAFSHDSTRLASASSDKTVKVWDAGSGACLQTLDGHSDWVRSVAFSHDSTRLASASDDKTVKIWDAGSGACLQTLEGHSRSASSVAFSLDSTRLASASGDKTVKVWDAGSGACLQTLEGHSNWVSSVAFSLDSTRLTSASDDKTVKIWDAGSGACLQTLEGHSDWVRSVAFSHDSTRLASASSDKTVKVWDAGSGACLQTLEGHSDWVRSVAFSHDSTRLASASSDQTVKAWDAGSGACLQTLEGHNATVMSVTFSHDSTRLVSASDDQTVKVWDAGSGACLQTLDIGRRLQDVSFDATGSYLRINTGTIALSSSVIAATSPPVATPQPPQYKYTALSSDSIWVTFNSENLLWLPQEYRSSCSTVSGTTIAFGVGSGKVWLCTVDLQES